jgi:hypothetical protein
MGLALGSGENDPSIPLCTFSYTSRTGVSTDLVIGPWDVAREGAIRTFTMSGHRRQVVSGLGDAAVFLRAKTLDDGNSVLLVTVGNRSFIVAGEFLELNAAKQLAESVLRNGKA